MMDATMELFPMLADTAARGVVLLAVAGLLALALWRASAAVRHLVWLTALVALLALPGVRVVVPELEAPLGIAFPWASAGSGSAAAAPVELLSGGPAEAGVVDVSTRSASTPAARSAVHGEGPDRVGRTASASDRGQRALSGDHALSGVSVSPASAAGTALPLVTWLMAIWAVGVLLLLAPVVAGWMGVRRLESRSRRLEHTRVRHLAARLSLRVGLRQEPRLLVGPARTMPMTWGVLRPAIVLPKEALEWPRGRLEAVLLHELAHVARRDCLTQLVAELARALHWFNPLVWVAAGRLRVERELACDDVALEGGARPSDYAQELLGLACSYRASLTTSMAAVAMARPTQLTSRLLAVLDERRSRRGVGGSMAIRAVAGAVALVLPLAAMAPAQTPPTPATPAAPVTPVPPPTSITTITPVTPVAPVTPVTPVAPAPAIFLMDWPAGLQDVTCAGEGSDWRSVNHSSNDDRSTLRMSRPGCELEVRLEGDVEFDGDALEIARLGRDARVRIEEDDGERERWLEVLPGSGGAPAFEYRVNRREAAFEASARAWYRAVMLQLFRSAGFAAEERVAGLLGRGGVQAVLQELDLLRSDYVRARYIRELAEQAELNEEQFRAVVRLAIERVDSDHYMAEILKTVAAEQPLTARLLDDYIQASGRLDSDHYRTEVLRGVIVSGRLSSEQVASVLESAGGMDSDHYRAELLKDVADRYALEPGFRQAYLRATESMDSDHYRTEILKRLFARDDLSTEELAAVLRATRMLESDHYRTELLKRVGARGLRDAAMRQAFFEAAAELESDHYYRESMAMLIGDSELSSALLVAVIDASARQVESDHYLSELLLGVLERHPITGDVRTAFMRAMDTMDSGHYRGRVADALLGQERR